MKNRMIILEDGFEQVPYNHNGFPVFTGSGWLSGYPGMEAAYHWHSDWEFCRVRKGHMACCINGRSVPLQEGQLLFINSGQLHKNFSPDGTDCMYDCILLHPSLVCGKFSAVDEGVRRITENSGFQYYVYDSGSAIHKQLDTLFGGIYSHMSSADPIHLLNVQAMTFSIACLLLENMPENDSMVNLDNRIPALRDMTGFIQAHYAEKLLVSDICRAANVSAGTCHNLFRRYLGMTPQRYLLLYRLEKASVLLKNTNLGMGHIAAATGFGGASYFSECFRSQYGMSPTEFRNSQPQNR